MSLKKLNSDRANWKKATPRIWNCSLQYVNLTMLTRTSNISLLCNVTSLTSGLSAYRIYMLALDPLFLYYY